MPELIRIFRRRYPVTQFNLAQGFQPQLIQRLAAGAGDFCFMIVPVTASYMEWQPLLIEEIYLAVPCGHHLADRISVSFAELVNEDTVQEGKGGDIRDIMDEYYRQVGFSPRLAYEINEPAAVLDFAREGLGVAFVPAIGRKQAESKGLTLVRLTNPTPIRGCKMAGGAT